MLGTKAVLHRWKAKTPTVVRMEIQTVDPLERPEHHRQEELCVPFVDTDGQSVRLEDARLPGKEWCPSPNRSGRNVAVRGEFPWPSLGKPGGRPRGLLVTVDSRPRGSPMAASGELAVAVDRPPA